jgi:hypothetical protein
MEKKKIKFNIGTLLILVGIVITAYYFIGGDLNGLITGSGKNKITCDMELENYVSFDSSIYNLQCQASNKGCGLFSINELSILPGDNVVVKMIGDGESITSKSVFVPEGASHLNPIIKSVKLTIEGCVDESIDEVTIRLEQGGNKVDEETKGV